MSRRFRFSLRRLGIYVAALCPFATLLAALIFSIELGGRVRLRYAVADTAMYVLGFMLMASVGHVVAASLLPAARSKFFTSRDWTFPVVCGVAVSIAAAIIEPPTDVLERW